MATPTATMAGTDADDEAALAPLSVTLIRTQTDPGSFDRGSDYFRKGMIRDPLRRGAVLLAESRGSSGGPYRVEATLAEKGAAGRNPVDYACDCPRGGFCKHVVALLLTWVKTPERFEVRPAIADLLAAKSREELVALVELLLRRRPELADLVDVAVSVPVEVAEAGSGAGALRTVEPGAIRRQVAAAFRDDDEGHDGYGRYDRYGWYDDEGDDHSSIADEIRPLVEIGDRYADAGQWANALTVYVTIVDEVLKHEDEFYDEDPVMGMLAACGAGLVRCLEAQGGLDEADRLGGKARAELITALYEVWDAGGSVDAAFAEEDAVVRGPHPWATVVGTVGGVVAEDEAEYEAEELEEEDAEEGAGAGAVAWAAWPEVGADIPAALARHATEGEREAIAGRLRQSLAETKADPYRAHATRGTIRFLVALRPEGGDEELLAEFQEAGLWADAAAMLLRLGRVDEASGTAARHLTAPHEFLGFADRMLAMGGERVGQGLALVDARLWETEGVKHENDMAYLEWLGRRYAAHDRPQEALEAERRRFKRRPDHVTYESVKVAATLPGQAEGVWVGLRPELLTELKKQAAWGPLIEIYLREKEAGAALEALAKLEAGERRTAAGGYGYWGYGLGGYRERVAQAAEAEHPEEAIRLYRLLADAEIEQRSRPHYQKAAEYLKRTMALYARLDRGEEWSRVITALREQHPRLRALKEELDSLGLR